MFELNPAFKKTDENAEEFSNTLETINTYVNIYQTYLLKIIHEKKVELSNIDYLTKLPEKMNHIPKITTLESIVDRLYYKVADISAFFEINTILLKKVIKTPDLLSNVEKNINADIFDDKLSEPPDKFIAWVLSS
jgi:hypothetical protein